MWPLAHRYVLPWPRRDGLLLQYHQAGHRGRCRCRVSHPPPLDFPKRLLVLFKHHRKTLLKSQCPFGFLITDEPNAYRLFAIVCVYTDEIFETYVFESFGKHQK